MPDYQQGKIYTIRKRTDDTLIYVGSTCETLARRLANHKRSFTNQNKKTTISLYSHITDLDDFTNNWYIEIFELCPCNSKMELNKREGEVIRQIGTINKNIAGRDRQQYNKDNPDRNKIYHKNNKDKIKKYYLNNLEKISEYQKEYRQKNTDKNKEYNIIYRLEKKDVLKEQRKEYRQKNADIIKERKKKYYEENKDKIREKYKEFRLQNKDMINEKVRQYRQKKKAEKETNVLVE